MPAQLGTGLGMQGISVNRGGVVRDDLAFMDRGVCSSGTALLEGPARDGAPNNGLDKIRFVA